MPGKPTGPISGNTSVCVNAQGETYAIAAVAGAERYTCTVPADAVITLGQGTTSIMVTFASTSGDVTVTADSVCGSSAVQSLPVSTISAPATPGSITGSTSVCAGTAGETYAISDVSSAIGYTWTVPPDAMITSGQGTTSITASFASTSGDVAVSADNPCGTSTVQSLPVSILTPTSIDHQPVSQSVCPDEDVFFSVVAAGSGPFSYQWFQDDIALSGQTGSTLELSQISVLNEGYYECEVTGACGTVISEPAGLTVNNALSFVTLPSFLALGLTPPIFDVYIECPNPWIQVE